MNVIGIFDNAVQAEQACQALRDMDIAAVISMERLISDPIGAEMPGQSFQNQPGQGRHTSSGGLLGALFGGQDAQRHEFVVGEAVRSGACTLTAESRRDAHAGAIAGVMRRHGARRTLRSDSIDG